MPAAQTGCQVPRPWPCAGRRQLQFFDAATSPPPADVTVVEVTWPASQAVQGPQAPGGWRVVASDRTDGWVAWRSRLKGTRRCRNRRFDQRGGCM